MVTERPASAAEAAALLAECGTHGRAVRFRGGGTKLAWGRPVPEPAVELCTGGLSGVVEHNAGDLTAVVRAGTSLAEAQAAFATAGQRLAVDPPWSGPGQATVGGVLATADSGPLRHGYGPVRDLVLGIQFALSDGTLARAGGKVIKNVAGYDLPKLFTGSFGTLGLIVEVAVRLHPRPPRTATVIGRSDRADAVARGASALTHAPVEADCLDVAWSAGAGAVLVRFGSADPGSRAAQAQRLLEESRLDTEVIADDDDEPVWDRQRSAQRSSESPAEPGGTAAGGGAVVRVSAAQTDLAAVLGSAEAMGAGVVGRAGPGVCYVRLPAAAPEDLVAAVEEVRARLPGRPCVVLDGPEAVRGALDPWGDVTGPVGLMRRVKARFDPAGVCRPGVFVGGI